MRMIHTFTNQNLLKKMYLLYWDIASNLQNLVLMPFLYMPDYRNIPPDCFTTIFFPLNFLPHQIFPAKFFPPQIFPAKFFPHQIFPAKFFPIKFFPPIDNWENYNFFLQILPLYPLLQTDKLSKNARARQVKTAQLCENTSKNLAQDNKTENGSDRP